MNYVPICAVADNPSETYKAPVKTANYEQDETDDVEYFHNV